MAFEASSGSPRERWIKAVLPALVIVAVYIGLINLGRSRELRRLRNELDEERKQAVSEDTLDGLHAQQSAAEKERGELANQIDQLQQSIDASLEQFGGGSATERMARVGQLCRELSISLLKQKPADNVQVSKVREASLQTLRKLLPDDAISYRQLELAGRYADMQTLLRRLPETANGVVPLAIELLEPEPEKTGSPTAGSERRWRVYLMMSAGN